MERGDDVVWSAARVFGSMLGRPDREALHARTGATQAEPARFGMVAGVELLPTLGSRGTLLGARAAVALSPPRARHRCHGSDGVGPRRNLSTYSAPAPPRPRLPPPRRCASGSAHRCLVGGTPNSPPRCRVVGDLEADLPQVAYPGRSDAGSRSAALDQTGGSAISTRNAHPSTRRGRIEISIRSLKKSGRRRPRKPTWRQAFDEVTVTPWNSRHAHQLLSSTSTARPAAGQASSPPAGAPRIVSSANDGIRSELRERSGAAVATARLVPAPAHALERGWLGEALPPAPCRVVIALIRSRTAPG